jgi:hypothetical protein
MAVLNEEALLPLKLFFAAKPLATACPATTAAVAAIAPDAISQQQKEGWR